MVIKTGLAVLTLAGVLVAIPIGSALAAPGGQVQGGAEVQGVWTCTVVRAGTIERPIMFTYGADGIFHFSSGTTINSLAPGPVNNSGFHSRGGAVGQWTKISKNVVNYKSVELLYDANGNLAGSFAVDSTQLLTRAGQLCSGRSECPNQTTEISLAKYTFDQNNPDDNIVGVTYLLPPGTPANSLCNRLSSGDGFPGLPIPHALIQRARSDLSSVARASPRFPEGSRHDGPPEDLWTAAHARLERARATLARAGGRHLLGRPSRLDLDSPFLRASHEGTKALVHQFYDESALRALP